MVGGLQPELNIAASGTAVDVLDRVHGRGWDVSSNGRCPSAELRSTPNLTRIRGK